MMLKLGLESGDQAVLDRLEKGIDLETASRVLRALSQSGIGTYVYLLFGLPGQTLEACEAARSFVAEHPIDFLNASIFRLPPEAAVAEEPEAFGVKRVAARVPDRLYQSFDAAGLAGAELRRWLSRRFFREPAVRAALGRTPPYLKSNHAVFFR